MWCGPAMRQPLPVNRQTRHTAAINLRSTNYPCQLSCHHWCRLPAIDTLVSSGKKAGLTQWDSIWVLSLVKFSTLPWPAGLLSVQWRNTKRARCAMCACAEGNFSAILEPFGTKTGKSPMADVSIFWNFDLESLEWKVSLFLKRFGFFHISRYNCWTLDFVY